ncbi:MAG: thiamine-monophosphate kinase, partial [Planctomycetaceae bacterium]|nr:thiamine-monophosphate kinase [Planctomycetaceae bacterium]
MTGEFELIDWIRTQQHPNDFVELPAGDDLAVLNWNAKDLLLVGVDQVLDGRHFESAKHSPGEIGKKVVNRNLSDCAAMGCLPAAIVVGMTLPIGVGLEYGKALYMGMKAAADPYYCAIVGGDTASWDGKLVVSVTILGRSAGVKPITRGGAEVGDGIYVTGPLGGSILGRHMTFSAKLAWGRQLGTYRPTGLPCIKAMIDISDGLSRDLLHLLAPSPTHPQLGATLEAATLALAADQTFAAALTMLGGLLDVPASTTLLAALKQRLATTAEPGALLAALPLRVRIELTEEAPSSGKKGLLPYAQVKKEQAAVLLGDKSVATFHFADHLPVSSEEPEALA